MPTSIEQIAKSVVHWLDADHDIKAEIKSCIGDSKVELDLYVVVDDEREPWYIGTFADPGLVLEYVGEYLGKPMVKANGVLMEAAARHIAGWASANY